VTSQHVPQRYKMVTAEATESQARVKVHAIVTSYEVAMMEATELRKLEFEALVVDEGHRLKNSSSRCCIWGLAA
jgi:SNF2 family DNA or RNA helicase